MSAARVNKVAFAGGLLLWLAAGGCRQPSSPDAARLPDSAGGSMMSLQVTSTAFDAGAPIPRKHTGEGEDLSPPLAWSGVPDGAVELALIMDDPDAPRPEPWVHWVLAKIPADATGLPEGVPRVERPDVPRGAIQGVNSWTSDRIGYRGPMPPEGHGTHHYHFMLYALDRALDVSSGVTKEDLLGGMAGHILAQGELIGTYER
jgi:Raf kinase inhibitor-like YbhB/YbcL family protein